MIRPVKIYQFLNEKTVSIGLIALFLIYSMVAYGANSYYLVLANQILRILFFFLFLMVPGYCMARLINKDYFDQSTSLLLAAPFSILLYIAIFCLLQPFTAPPWAYLTLTLASFGLIGFLCFKRLKGELFQFKKLSREEKYGILMVLMAALIASCYVAVAAKNPSEVYLLNNWNLAQRGFSDLPIDNRLQYDVARIFAHNRPLESFFFYDPYWSISDRPAMVGFLNALVALVFLDPDRYSYFNYHHFGFVLNSLFLFPLVIFFKTLFPRNRVAYLIPLAVILNGFIFMNIYYTWPKLFAVFFTLASLVFWQKKELGWLSLFIIGALWGLAANCHTGSALSLPILTIFFFIHLLIKRKPHLIVSSLFAFVLFLMPWTLYKKHYSPDHQTLLKAHYFKQCHKENNLWKDCILPFLKKGPDREFYAHRVKQTKVMLTYHNLKDFVNSTFKGDWVSYHRTAFPFEWNSPVATFGAEKIILGLLSFALMILIYFVGVNKPLPFQFTFVTPMALFIIISYTLNIFAKWQFPIPHSLPYTEHVLAVGILAGLSFSLHSSIRYIAIGLILMRFMYYVIQSAIFRKFDVFGFFNVVTVIGIIILFLIYYSFCNSSSKNEERGTDAPS